LVNWRDLAACRGMDTDLFYVTENTGVKGGEKERIDLAKKICASCVVQEDCLEYALEYSLDYGIWSGMTPGERRKEERGRKAA
jgi:WhiB family redox-sensing transcriptional regulator